MFKAFGFLISLWGLSIFFNLSFTAFDKAMAESFKTVEIVAQKTQAEITITEK